ncbi:MAG: HNH endonuclease [Methylococcales bacterium]|nr:HNH endonuclease [Methylococcales bacterium]
MNEVYGHTWRKLRPVVFERDGGRCQIRGEGCLGVASEVDHICAVALGGALFDLENLRAACRPCNRRLGGVVGRGLQLVAPPSREW